MIFLLLACADEATQALPSTRTPTTAVSAPMQEQLPAQYGLGRAATEAELAAWDRDVDPSWAGLPPGKGTVEQGKALFLVKCLICHGPDAKGGSGWAGPGLIATAPLENFGVTYKDPRLVGNYWTHVSTLYDYVYRVMPQNAAGSLTPDETYALVAYILAENQIVPPTFVADQDSIKTVKMPVKATFVDDNRLETSSFR